MKLVARMGLGQKLGVVVIALLIPLAFLLVQYVRNLEARIDADRLALEGLAYFQSVEKAMIPTATYASRALAEKAGGVADPRLAELEARVTAALAAHAAEEAKREAPVNGPTTNAAALEAAWDGIRASWRGRPYEEVRRDFGKLLATYRESIDEVAMHYALDRDEDPGVLAAQDVMAQWVPDAAVRLYGLSAVTIPLAGARSPDAATLAAVGEARSLLELSGDDILSDTERAARLLADRVPGIRSAAEGPAVVLDRSVHEFTGWLEAVVYVRAVPFSPADVIERGSSVVEHALELHEAMISPLLAHIDARHSRSVMQRNVWLGVIASLVLGALLVTWWIVRGLVAAAGAAVHALHEIEQGRYDNRIVADSHDEMGRILRSVDAMQTGLRERIEKDRTAAAENARIRTALDKVSTSVMVADPEGRIIYMNEAVHELFRAQAAQIRRQIPSFDPDRILGSSFDAFHRSPSHQRGMVEALRGNHAAEIRLGEAVLRISASPVVDAAGARVGTVVQWLDRSQEVAIEEEVQFIVRQALEGDLTRRIREEGKSGFFLALSQGVNGLLDNMAGVIRTIKHAAVEVSTGADEISKGNANLSQRTEEQASSLEETASSMEEMTSTVKQNADNAAQANQLAVAARSQAEKGGAVVGQAVAAMGEINEASRRIAEIIGVIDEIAFQTNLLALNAAVEAARAGEQGRGFAVVASEVRNLASRSAEAAKEIKALIQDSVQKVGEGSKLVDQSGRSLAEIVGSVKKVTDIVAEIAAASQEQSAGIEQVNKAVMSMDEVTQQNAALVEEAAAAAEALTQQARQLRELMAGYRTGEEDANVAWSGHERRQTDEWRNPPQKRSLPPARPDRPSRATPTARAAPAADPASPARQAVGADAEWSEF